jgi:hypothetical protein
VNLYLDARLEEGPMSPLQVVIEAEREPQRLPVLFTQSIPRHNLAIATADICISSYSLIVQYD